MKKGLVIEGGGLRGAYTAGALTWLIDHDIMFDYGVGISIGALYLGAFMTKNKALLKEYSINLAGSKDNVGIKPLLKEGSLVGYDNVFKQVVNNPYHIDIEALNNCEVLSQIGVYDLSVCETIWIDNDQIDKDSLFIKAACTLPMFGHKVNIDGKDYLDGGITTMIPIEQSIKNGNQKHFVITTKPANYVRKPYSKFVLWLFKVVYHRYPKLAKDIAKRDKAYYDERNKIKELENAGSALHIYPSKDSGVTRFGGNKEQLSELFELGYNDMETNKEKIMKFINTK
ncbi:MAG: patatin family protein [Erysipelotrichaceae bacterium]|nr:patatin family protein [Erysipelotrichaceae bacterium]MDD3924397.1 patatin family protein [Erysipelotrichaceae bacterium]MDD4642086.1 patatin family protein [Erysipelotrichaceae bacterium]